MIMQQSEFFFDFMYRKNMFFFLQTYEYLNFLLVKKYMFSLWTY